MDIKQLKADLESNTYAEKLLIFKYSDDKFIIEQYINEISSILGVKPIYLDDLNIIHNLQNQENIFEQEPTEYNNCSLYVYDTINLDNNVDIPEFINYNNNIIIVAQNISKEIENKYQIINIPKLENWQIKDYVYSNLEGVKPEYIDWLLDNTQYNLYRLQMEIDKFKLFNINERNILFQKMLDDNAFDDITKYNIWDFTNCISNKNIDELNNIYMDINNIKMEPMGVLNALYQNFRKLIMVWMNKNPIPDNTGLTTKQIYAINKLPRVWNGEQLVEILKFLTDLDFKIKTGQLPIEYLINYMVIKIISM